MSKKNKKQDFYWHESAGARILLPSQFSIKQPFPELYATLRKNVMNILVLITSYDKYRRSAENIIKQSLVSNNVIAYELINTGSIYSPYKGIECIVQEYHKVLTNYSYDWNRIYYLDDAAEIIADIQISGDGLFSESEHMCQTVMDSFSWNPDQGVALKFDGDEIAFRTRYAKKRKRRRVKPDLLPQLPLQISYLQPFMDELMTYAPEEINEDLDATLLDELIKQRTAGMSLEEARNKIGEDSDILSKWIDEDAVNRSAAEYIIGTFFGFSIYPTEKNEET
jgi:hypothetical protein